MDACSPRSSENRDPPWSSGLGSAVEHPSLRCVVSTFSRPWRSGANGCLFVLVWSHLFWLPPQAYATDGVDKGPLQLDPGSLRMKPRPLDGWVGLDTPCHPWTAPAASRKQEKPSPPVPVCREKAFPWASPVCFAGNGNPTQLRRVLLVFAVPCGPTLDHRFHFLINRCSCIWRSWASHAWRPPSSVGQMFSFATGEGNGVESPV